MKLFGGGSPQHPKNEPDAHYPAARQEQEPGAARRPTAPKPGEQPGAAAHKTTAPRPGEQPGTAARRPTAPHPGEQPGAAAHRPTAPHPGEQPGTAARRPTAPRPGEQPGTAAHRPTAPRPGEPSRTAAPGYGAVPPAGAAYRPAAPGQLPRSEGAPPEPADGKKKLSGRKLRNRIVIVIIAATLAIIAGMSAAAAMMMRPPAVAQAAGKPADADPPVQQQFDTPLPDAESEEVEYDEGDALDVDEDMGARREGVYTVLVAATDEDETRTDALMVATLDTVNDTVNVINIPRDLMSNCSRVGDAKKINAAYGTKKGIETTKSEVKKVLGFTPDQYVVVNFNGIADIIDALGGVTYEVPWRMKYDDPTQNLHIDFQPGETKMDGKAAVEFMRWRKNNSGVSTGVKGTTGGDEERIEKDQKFLKFLAKEVFSIGNVPKIPSLAQVVFKNVKTDLTAGEVLWLAWQLYDVKNENINMMTLPGYGAMSYAGTGTMYSFYFPYKTQTLEMVNEFINPYEKKITSIDVITSPQKGSSKSSSSSGSKSSSSSSSKSSSTNVTKPAETSDSEKDSNTSGSGESGNRSENSGGSGNSSSGGSSDGSGTDTSGSASGTSSGTDGTEPGGTSGPSGSSGGISDSSGGTSGTSGSSGGAEGGDGTDSPEPASPEGGSDTDAPSADTQNSGTDAQSSGTDRAEQPSDTNSGTPSGTEAPEPAANNTPAPAEPAPAEDPSFPDGLFAPGMTPDPPAGT